MDATRIIAIRHGETAWNVDTRIQGQLDIPLNETGEWQARRLGQVLASEPITAVYASDLKRAHRTAEHVAGAVGGLAVQPDIGLRERGFGSFEGLTFQDIEARLPEQAHQWRTRVPDFAPEGGESLIEFRKRVLDTLDALAARHPGEQIVLVAHGGVMDVLYRAATGQELQAPRTWKTGNAVINRLLWTPESVTLIGWADDAHLNPGTRDDTTVA